MPKLSLANSFAFSLLFPGFGRRSCNFSLRESNKLIRFGEEAIKVPDLLEQSPAVATGSSAYATFCRPQMKAATAITAATATSARSLPRGRTATVTARPAIIASTQTIRKTPAFGW